MFNTFVCLIHCHCHRPPLDRYMYWCWYSSLKRRPLILFLLQAAFIVVWGWARQKILKIIIFCQKSENFCRMKKKNSLCPDLSVDLWKKCIKGANVCRKFTLLLAAAEAGALQPLSTPSSSCSSSSPSTSSFFSSFFILQTLIPSSPGLLHPPLLTPKTFLSPLKRQFYQSTDGKVKIMSSYWKLMVLSQMKCFS